MDQFRRGNQFLDQVDRMQRIYPGNAKAQPQAKRGSSKVDRSREDDHNAMHEGRDRR